MKSGEVRFIRGNDIRNVILVDRSARTVYVGIREYWKTRHSEEKMPNIYFMNPDGFSNRNASQVIIVNPQKNLDMFVGSLIAPKKILYPDCFLGAL